jgi:hypothetical protein
VLATDSQKETILELRIKIMQREADDAKLIEYLKALIVQKPTTLHLHIALLEVYKRKIMYMRCVL